MAALAGHRRLLPALNTPPTASVESEDLTHRVRCTTSGLRPSTSDGHHRRRLPSGTTALDEAAIHANIMDNGVAGGRADPALSTPSAD
jgi:hypothetical protein